jgi:hypothetical protein
LLAFRIESPEPLQVSPGKNLRLQLVTLGKRSLKHALSQEVIIKQRMPDQRSFVPSIECVRTFKAAKMNPPQHSQSAL